MHTITSNRHYLRAFQAIGFMALVFMAVVAFTGCKKTIEQFNPDTATESELIQEFTTRLSASSTSSAQLAELVDRTAAASIVDLMSESSLDDREKIAIAIQGAQLIKSTNTFSKYEFYIDSPYTGKKLQVHFWIIERDGKKLMRFAHPKGEE